MAVVYAQYLLVMRSSLLDEMGSDYLVTARAKGLRDDVVRRRHAVPNALLPTVTLIFIDLGGIVAGTILVESVFSWPGLGNLFYEALKVPDLPLVQGMFMFFSAAVIVMNLLADLVYPLLDPRVRPDEPRPRSAARAGWRGYAAGAPSTGSGASSGATAPGVVGPGDARRAPASSRWPRRCSSARPAERHPRPGAARRVAELGLPARHRRVRPVGRWT